MREKSNGVSTDTNCSSGGWPVPLAGVTETIVTTLGPNGRWNAAALGLHAGDGLDAGNANDENHAPPHLNDGDCVQPVTARTWGNTRTRRNFEREGEGYVQFTTDPIDFVEAALSIYELEDPVLDSADAWVKVSVEQIGSGTEGDTHWERWELVPETSSVVTERVPTIDRGFTAVVEATIAASRLGVTGYDDETLRSRLEYFSSVIDRTGDACEREALDRLRSSSQWP